MERPLRHKQLRWAEAFLANPNATEAARVAGYKGNDKTLAVIGSENLRKPNIQEYLKERTEEIVITTNELLRDVKDIAKNSERDADRLKAYDMLGKNLGAWGTDTVRHEGAITQRIEVVFTEE